MNKIKKYSDLLLESALNESVLYLSPPLMQVIKKEDTN